MSDYHFTDGNLIVLYCIYRGKLGDGILPDYVKERVKVCLETFSIIIRSKPDKHKTMIIVVADRKSAQDVKGELIKGGVDERIIGIDTTSKSVSETFNHIVYMIKSKTNPPHIYFVGSVWLRDIYDSQVVSKLKGYKIQFEGALDHRAVEEVEKEKAMDIPKKGIEYYKRKAKDKAVDMLLDYIFPE
jgi:hypothetical protein